MEFVKINYSNIYSKLAKHRAILTSRNGRLHNLALTLKHSFGGGGVDEDNIYINVMEWDKILNETNYMITNGYYIFRLQETEIKG